MIKTRTLVVDTSVAIKWFFDEPQTPFALELLEACRAGRCRAIVPDLIYAEFTNAVWKRVVRHSMRKEDGAKVVESFAKLPLAISPVHRLLLPAYHVAVEYSCTAYDAVFVVLSTTLAADLITADERLHRAVQDLGCVRSLEEWDHE